MCKIIKIATILFLLTKYQYLSSQNFMWGGGFTFGYKSTLQEQGFSIYSRIDKRIDIYSGYSILGKFNGTGFGGGVRWIILDKKIQPYLGVAGSYNIGRKVNLNIDGVKGLYSVSNNSFAYSEIGVMYKFVPVDDAESNLNVIILLVGNLTYRYAINNYSISYLEGNYSSVAENNLYNRVGNGIGGGISLIILLNKKKN